MTIVIEPEPVDLGQHILEVHTDDQSALVFKKTECHRLVQLEREEAYRLMITLQRVFQREMEQRGKQQRATRTESKPYATRGAALY